ncbi:uncharacterized protein CC84DRAFT_179841 [Paraphaeosphaeria sporulosa]|uniref:Uncharacterized protein n=1 Tax=Paraphaeosphaeria sporulosa TaxID=1460663 RepID=A0A177D1I7_9PLEO|nr:uncharacterized protein CC84DRAFT_179841 [Paraphaeosphaeria sporulosa]OAG13097.1 hypothetical protein CC84DRAFT_179841 [Paraphaeosphaeria sporulosa]
MASTLNPPHQQLARQHPRYKHARNLTAIPVPPQASPRSPPSSHAISTPRSKLRAFTSMANPPPEKTHARRNGKEVAAPARVGLLAVPQPGSENIRIDGSRARHLCCAEGIKRRRARRGVRRWQRHGVQHGWRLWKRGQQGRLRMCVAARRARVFRRARTCGLCGMRGVGLCLCEGTALASGVVSAGTAGGATACRECRAVRASRVRFQTGWQTVPFGGLDWLALQTQAVRARWHWAEMAWYGQFCMGVNFMYMRWYAVHERFATHSADCGLRESTPQVSTWSI